MNFSTRSRCSKRGMAGGPGRVAVKSTGHGPFQEEADHDGRVVGRRFRFSPWTMAYLLSLIWFWRVVAALLAIELPKRPAHPRTGDAGSEFVILFNHAGAVTGGRRHRPAPSAAAAVALD